jgi:Cof subfamily protein (haloacid dehalogenase superfamily)
MSFRLLVCDVDGTLLDPNGRLTERTAEAVARVAAAGVGVALASGRMLPGLVPLCSRLGLDGPQIASHGALVATPGGDVVARVALSADDVRAHLAFAREAGVAAVLSWDDHSVTDRLTPRVVEAFEPYDEPIPEVHPDPEALAGTGPLKTTLCVDEGTYDAVRRAAAARFGGRYTATSANRRELELLRAEAGKAAAARTLAAALGIGMAEVAAIGDGPNDVDLLRAAGASVAMGDGDPAVRASATFVAPGSGEDGAAVAIGLLFPEPAP